MEQEEKMKGRPAYDARKCHEAAAVMSVLISRTLEKSKPSSIAEGLLMITLATGRVIHVLGALMGVDPKRICRDFCTSLTRYFDLGGDGEVDEAMEILKQKGN